VITTTDHVTILSRIKTLFSCVYSFFYWGQDADLPCGIPILYQYLQLVIILIAVLIILLEISLLVVIDIILIIIPLIILIIIP